MKKTIILAVCFLFILLIIGCGEQVPPPGTTYRVTYFCFEDGSGYPPNDNNRYQFNAQATVLGRNTLLLPGHIFDGWNTRSNGAGTPYKEGDKITVNRDIFLYAMWKLE
jgi:uncharacterized repeat protein (TIGR02543 family)